MADTPPLEDQVRLEIVDSVAWITIDRQDRGNALSPEARDRLRDLFRSVGRDFEARAVVLTGAGDRIFCTGADLSAPRPSGRREGAPERAVGDVRHMMLDGQYTLFPAVMDCDLPVIAAVNGTAAGMGAHLALACDLVIAADTARFIEVFVRRGLVVDALGAYLLPRLVGPHKAKELVFFGDDLGAAEAERIGLINRSVPADELTAVAAEMAGRLAAGPTRALSMSKALINLGMHADRQTMMSAEADAVEANTHTEDFAEGMAAFAERRAPQWRGW